MPAPTRCTPRTSPFGKAFPTVAEVVRLMEEMDALDTALVTSPLGRAVVQPLWRELRDDMLDRLEGVSLEDLYRQARQSGGADSTAGKSADFDI